MGKAAWPGVFPFYFALDLGKWNLQKVDYNCETEETVYCLGNLMVCAHQSTRLQAFKECRMERSCANLFGGTKMDKAVILVEFGDG